MSKEDYTIKDKAPGKHLTADMRSKHTTAWNAYINSSTTITARRFARLHNLPYSTWQRELKRGATGSIVKRGKSWVYPEYDL